jgi:hypothetical protein
MMAIAMLFSPTPLTTEQYDEVIRRLDAAGAGSPAGRGTHVAFGSGDKIRVLEVWDSADDFRAFAATLIPILQDLGIDPGQPETGDVHASQAG